MEKDWPKRPSDCQLHEAQKTDSDRAVTPAAEVVHVPAHLAPPGPPQAKQLCHLHAQLSLGKSCHRQKKPCIYVHRVALVLSDFLWPYSLWPYSLCQASLSGRGVLQTRILERIGQHWLPSPSRALHFLLPWPPTPLRTWSCQNPCGPSSCTTSTPALTGQPQSSRAASGAKPQWMSHMQRWK